MIHAAPHIANVRYAIRNISAEATRLQAAGKRILYCNIGDPLKFDFATPPHLVEIVAKAMRDGHNGYAPSMGIPSARAAVAKDLVQRGLASVRPDDVVITAGASEAIDLSLSALLSPGDEVLLPAPGYPLYYAVANRLQAKVVPYYLDESRGWRIDASDIAKRVTPKTRAVVVCNPNNPTGSVATTQELREVLDIARRQNLVVLSDEIYERLIFDGEPTSMGSLASDVAIIVLSGLSKAYLAPGWRVGWMAFANPALTQEIATAVGRLADARLCGPAPAQHAVEPALFGSQAHLPPLRAKLRARRDLTVKRLNSIAGISVVEPKAAFYALPRLELPGLTSDETFVLGLLRETGVLFVHGEGFGQMPGSHHFRVVYLPEEAVLTEALEKLAHYVAHSS